MPAVVIEGVPPWDGRYEFDDFAFTNGELFEIKKLSGIRASELLEALEANDTSAYVGVGMVVLARAGHRVEASDLWDAKVGSISIDLGGDDADPPTTSAPGDAPPATDSSSGSGSEEDGV